MIRAVLVCVIGLVIAGCARHPGNARLVLGSRYSTPTFHETDSVLDRDQDARTRSRWATTLIVAPIDGTITRQTLRSPKFLKKTDPPRYSGQYPTPDTALRIDEKSWFADCGLMFDELGRSLGEIVLMPYRAIKLYTSRPLTWSPERAWKRTNQQSASAWSSGQPLIPKTNNEDHDDDTNQ